jgi:hypothetical protein
LHGLPPHPASRLWCKPLLQIQSHMLQGESQAFRLCCNKNHQRALQTGSASLTASSPSEVAVMAVAGDGWGGGMATNMAVIVKRLMQEWSGLCHSSHVLTLIGQYSGTVRTDTIFSKTIPYSIWI